MRVIGGKYRGKKLFPIEGKGIRPTADRVREAVFNILQMHISGSSFLDLFSGSGAMAIEAISRGADEVFLCDKNTEIIDKNLLQIEEVPIILKCDYLEALSIAQRTQKTFDVIYIDPPYATAFGTIALENIMQNQLLRQDGCCIIEGNQPMEKCLDIRKYGHTYINIFRR